jgi:hypothetical protein
MENLERMGPIKQIKRDIIFDRAAGTVHDQIRANHDQIRVMDGMGQINYINTFVGNCVLGEKKF